MSLTHREVCCLPGAWIRDITKRLPVFLVELHLIQPTYYYCY